MENLQFKYPWRAYQKRVLDELTSHLDDAQLHVVAAPGSGKTVLGLEVMGRLARPAIVFAPSLAIRNQWKHRLIDLFLPECADQGWISMDIRRPALLTITTYQGFHAALTGAADEETGEAADAADLDLVRQFKEIGVGTLIFDEAHHLRKDWQRSLVELRNALPRDVTTVALTATPPYDVSASEWANYEDLCGPIDCEISVPELVRAGDLCPHQDLICLASPTASETEFIDAFWKSVNAFAHGLLNDNAFLSCLETIPWFSAPFKYEEEIFSNSAFVVAALVFLKAAGRPVPKDALALFAVELEHLPALDRDFLESLVTGATSGDASRWFEDNGLRQEILKNLRSFGALRRGKPMLAEVDEIDRRLRNSLGKIQSIKTIVAAESSSLGPALRMVVLTDYIYRDLTPSPGQQHYEPVKIGAVPLFETLRHKGEYLYKVGLLTGSLVILPVDAIYLFESAAAQKGIGKQDFNMRPLPHDADYAEIELKSRYRHETVHLVTSVFEQGGVTILVGTQALLGEGWDAPCINTLVLASTVGSFMLSNQMRGRAIRIDPDKPNKTANIWHLACVNSLEQQVSLESVRNKVQSLNPITPAKTNPARLSGLLGDDWDDLSRRFRAFEGLSVADPPYIETGIGRMGFPEASWIHETLEHQNAKAFTRSAKRDLLFTRWRGALETFGEKALLRRMVTTRRPSQTWVYRNQMSSLGLGSVLVTAILVILSQKDLPPGILAFMGLAVVVVFVFALKEGGNPLRTIRLAIQNRTLRGNMSQLGQAVLQTMIHTGDIRTPLGKLTLTVNTYAGDSFCTLEGAEAKECALFLDAMKQLLGPIESPKYLIVRRVGLFGKKMVDYHPVPDRIARRKADAEVFLERWTALVSDADLVSVRSREGRRVLLQARADAFASHFVPQAELLGRWE
ncbi:DEAD/DEAH box helicase family protein [uncultured Roseibium sp.]|uniref:DEAD/DEAH box helicase family protein n=1 Tax=uncultured Roseibium sp. TaxID=1936171 RepID=UPI002626C370|nr:DEAD/DEAH box helicase family protein [uncultured Roseibium sp.]